MAQDFPTGEDARVNLWWKENHLEGQCPPEGIIDVDPFAFDVLSAGEVLKLGVLDVSMWRFGIPRD